MTTKTCKCKNCKHTTTETLSLKTKKIKFNPKQFGKVVVLMGGTSSEREVSLMSGNNALSALLELGIDAAAIDVGADIVQQLLKAKPDRAFIALHGQGGEDGTMQALLEMLQIPYTGSNVQASSLAMDKQISKYIWDKYGLPILPSAIIEDPEEDFAVIASGMDFPICIKPVHGGSTVGVTKVLNKTQLPKAYELAKKTGDQVMVEPWVIGREFTVGIFDETPLPIVEIRPEQEFYDYEAKYLSDKTQFICPCDLSQDDQEALQEVALLAYKALGCRHIGRADFIQDKDGNFWLLEMNTIPGLTAHSLVPTAARAIGIDFNTLIYKILEFTL